MKFHYLLLVCFAISILAGCQQSSGTAPASRSMIAADDPSRMADYIKNEPAVRSVEPWDNPYGPGLTVQTAHYTLHTTLLEPLMLRQFPAFLESAYQAYQRQLPRTLESGYPLKVYLFGTREQWEQYTRNTTGSDAGMYLQIKRGAYVLNGIVVAYNIGRKQTFSVVGHEGWHQFNQRLFAYRLPSWLDEGIATLFETCRYTQGQFVFEPQRNLMRLGALKQTIQAGGFIPLRQLILLNPGQVLNSHGDDAAVAAFYAQNYALVRFLREHNYGIYLRKYHTLLAGGADGTWPLNGDFAALAADRTRRLTVGWNTQVSGALFDYYMAEDIRKLEAEYNAFCQKIIYRIRLKK